MLDMDTGNTYPITINFLGALKTREYFPAF